MPPVRGALFVIAAWFALAVSGDQETRVELSPSSCSLHGCPVSWVSPSPDVAVFEFGYEYTMSSVVGSSRGTRDLGGVVFGSSCEVLNSSTVSCSPVDLREGAQEFSLLRNGTELLRANLTGVASPPGTESLGPTLSPLTGSPQTSRSLLVVVDFQGANYSFGRDGSALYWCCWRASDDPELGLTRGVVVATTFVPVDRDRGRCDTPTFETPNHTVAQGMILRVVSTDGFELAKTVYFLPETFERLDSNAASCRGTARLVIQGTGIRPARGDHSVAYSIRFGLPGPAYFTRLCSATSDSRLSCPLPNIPDAAETPSIYLRSTVVVGVFLDDYRWIPVWGPAEDFLFVRVKADSFSVPTLHVGSQTKVLHIGGVFDIAANYSCRYSHGVPATVTWTSARLISGTSLECQTIPVQRPASYLLEVKEGPDCLSDIPSSCETIGTTVISWQASHLPIKPSFKRVLLLVSISCAACLLASVFFVLLCSLHTHRRERHVYEQITSVQ